MKKPSQTFKRSLVIQTIACLLIIISPLAGEKDTTEPIPLKTGKQIFMAACANCHGADGRGVPNSLLGFDQELPDFTDCQFARREPDGDWVIVAHEGGPIRGFSHLMPSFGKVLSAAEILKAVQYIRRFCTDKSWPRGELNMPKPLVTEKGFPEDELIVLTSVEPDTSKISNKVVYEKRIGSLNQVEVVIPYGWNKRAEVMNGADVSRWSADLGDIALGYKRVLLHSHRSGSILSIFGELKCPTGDQKDGFGKGAFVFEPFFAYSQALPGDFFLHSQLGVEVPFDSEMEKEGFLRLALGRSFNFTPFGRTWSPMVEVLMKRELASGEKVLFDILPQIQITLNKRQHIMFNIGVRIPLNQTEGRSTAVMAYVLWDWFDGGFFEGW
jgi:hypothetical protein